MVTMDTCGVLLSCLALALTTVQAWVELPKLNQMKLLYPGYLVHNGKYRDSQVMQMIGGDQELLKSHDTASLRMSYALNKYGGRHAIGTEPVLLSKRGRDSITGRDGQQYIFRNTAFGPFLAAKYGNPVVAVPDRDGHTQTMAPFWGKQGIVRFVSYHRHAGGHVALWDCDHFHESRDWTAETNLISMEFWETPDSYCPPPKTEEVPKPKLVAVDTQNMQLIERHNFPSTYTADNHEKRHKSDTNGHRMRHHRHESRQNHKFDNLWVQR